MHPILTYPDTDDSNDIKFDVQIYNNDNDIESDKEHIVHTQHQNTDDIVNNEEYDHHFQNIYNRCTLNMGYPILLMIYIIIIGLLVALISMFLTYIVWRLKLFDNTSIGI